MHKAKRFAILWSLIIIMVRKIQANVQILLKNHPCLLKSFPFQIEISWHYQHNEMKKYNLYRLLYYNKQDWNSWLLQSNQVKCTPKLHKINELIIWVLNPFQDGNNELIIAKLNPLVIPIIWLMGFMFKKSIQYWFLKWLTSVFK